MKTQTPTVWQFLTTNPKSAYTQLFLTGTRIRARVVFGMHMCAEQPMSPEDIAEDLNLPLEAVKEAIAYCQSNPREIVVDFEREERLMRASGMTDPSYQEHCGFKILPPEQISKLLNS